MHEHLPLHERIRLAEQAVVESDLRLRENLTHLRRNFGKGVRGRVVNRLRSLAGIGLGVAAAAATTWALWPKHKRRAAGAYGPEPKPPASRKLVAIALALMPMAVSALSRSGFVSPSTMNWISLVSSLMAAKGRPSGR